MVLGVIQLFSLEKLNFFQILNGQLVFCPLYDALPAFSTKNSRATQGRLLSFIL